MSNADTIETLKKLAKGKNALDRAQFRELIAFLVAEPIDELLDAVFPPKLVRAKPTKTPVALWVADIQSSAKKVNWKSAEVVSKLYDLAGENGYSSKAARQKSLPKAAQDIASQVGEDRTAEMFREWVENFLAQHQMA